MPADDAELINMKPENDECLHLRDYTAHDANLIPVLPEEIEFRRVENFHCRNLTIVEQSPIAVRKFQELTKELGTVKEPISVVLPTKLPFDLGNYHPCLDSQAPTLSDDEDITNESVNSRDPFATGFSTLDEPYYRLAERIYHLEKLKIEQRSARSTPTVADTLDGEQQLLNESDDDASLHSLHVTAPAAGEDGFSTGREQECNPPGGEQGNMSCESVTSVGYDNDRPTLWNASPSSDVDELPLAGGNTSVEDEHLKTTNSTGIANRDHGEGKLHHVSMFNTQPPLAYYDPFDEPEDDHFWPFSLGTSVWNFVVGSAQSLASRDSVGINMESHISSFYSKEGRAMAPAAGGGSFSESAAPDSLSQQLRSGLAWRSMLLQQVGVNRYCTYDPSAETVVTTMYDTGDSSLRGQVDHLQSGEDVDCTLGISSCNESVMNRNHERYHSEAAIPSAFTFFQEDGTVIRYVEDFLIYSPNCDRITPLNQLSHFGAGLWLVGKLKLVSTLHTVSELRALMHPTLNDELSSNDSSRGRQRRKSKVVGVRARIMDFFIDYGCKPSDVPALYVISEHDIYYRLDRPAVRYASYHVSFLLYYNLSTRLTKEYQRNCNRRLNEILAEIAAEDGLAVTAWNESMHLPGFTEADLIKLIEMLYTDCLHLHLFQNRRKEIDQGQTQETNAHSDIGSGTGVGSYGSIDIKAAYTALDSPYSMFDASKTLGSTTVAEDIKIEPDGENPISAPTDAPAANPGTSTVGLLLCDLMALLKEHRPFVFFDESFVVPEFMSAAHLTEKYLSTFQLLYNEAEMSSYKRDRDMSIPTLPSVLDVQAPIVAAEVTRVPKMPKRASLPKSAKASKAAKDGAATKIPKEPKSSKMPAAVEPLKVVAQPPPPVEIKSKVSGRIIKRNSKLTDAADIQLIAPEEPKPVVKRSTAASEPDEAMKQRQQMLIDKEKQCNALTLPDDFEYTCYNTCSDVSGDEASKQPLALLNDCNVELNDARYYPRDIPLRMLRFYGADDILDIANVCRQFSASPSNVDPLLPKFSFAELERSLLYTTSVDVYKPLEPSTFRFEPPQCLCSLVAEHDDWFVKFQGLDKRVNDLYLGLMRCLNDYSRFDSWEYRVRMMRILSPLSDKKKDAQERDIKASMPDYETLSYFMSTHGGCLYRGRFRHIIPEPEHPIPYINCSRWNRRFKKVERLLAATKSYTYTNVDYEYLADGVVISLNSRLEGVPMDLLANSRREGADYRVIYPSDVFEVLPTFSKKLLVWQTEPLPETPERSDLLDTLNDRLKASSLLLFGVDPVPVNKAEPVLGFGFRESMSLLTAKVALHPMMLTEYTWPCLLRIHLFYAVYSCRRKYVYRINSGNYGDAPSSAMNAMEDEDEDEEDDEAMDKEAPDGGKGESTAAKPNGSLAATSNSEDDVDDEEEEEEEAEAEAEETEEGGRVGRRRGPGTQRYSPYYEFEIQWYPDNGRVKHLFKGSVSIEAVKVVMEKLRVCSFFELEVRDRLILLRWMGELLSYSPEAKRFIDQRNDEFFNLKAALVKSDSTQAAAVAASADGKVEDVDRPLNNEMMSSPGNFDAAVKSETDGDLSGAAESSGESGKDTDKSTENTTAASASQNPSGGTAHPKVKSEPESSSKSSASIPVKLEPVDAPMGVDGVAIKEEPGTKVSRKKASAGDVKMEGDSQNPEGAATNNARDNDQGAAAASGTDTAKRKKPKEIMKDLAELEERYVQRNVHIGRDRFYNDYYYFGGELGYRIFVRTLPSARFTAQRNSMRTKQQRTASFGPEKFKFRIADHAKQLQADRIFSADEVPGQKKRKSAGKGSTSEPQENNNKASNDSNSAPNPQEASSDPKNGAGAKDEGSVPMIKRRKPKGRKPKMVKPRLRRSREFFDRQPTSFNTVFDYLNYLTTIPPRLSWGVMDTPWDIRMFIERLSPLTSNERALQAKLIQLEPEFNNAASLPNSAVEAWRAPTPYGHLLISLTQGVKSFSSNIIEMSNTTLLRYGGMKSESPSSEDQAMHGEREKHRRRGKATDSASDGNPCNRCASKGHKLCGADVVKVIDAENKRLAELIGSVALDSLACCCGDVATVASGVSLIIQLVVLCESVISRYCDWLSWNEKRAMWWDKIDSMYRNMQRMSSKIADKSGSRTSPARNCACGSRGGSAALNADEKLLLQSIEELGVWFQYVYVFNHQRMNLFSKHQLHWTSALETAEPTLLCSHITAMCQGSMVYMFGGYREWLLSLAANNQFPRDLLSEMVKEYGSPPSESSKASLLKLLHSMEPVVPVETLEVYIESVWLFEVPKCGRFARLALRSVGYEKYDPEGNPASESIVEGRFVPYLQSVYASVAAQDSESTDNKVAASADYFLRGESRESQRFVVYAPLDSVDRASEFVLPLTFLAGHMSHVWRPSMKCEWDGKESQVHNMCYGAADLWRTVQIDTGDQKELVNLWEITPV
ncbi:chloroquine resistance marker, putative [Babesia ovata]|uniref:Chloroquine resistance marker, putative n=1 Tax=Babesia ovata TaxID=189622 RepID=A0A2H6KEE4_9APIC|nr:chloroquine resistance marker, putative [Babesia ovata]GBE61363.1 chloroquine resistance marker, putative [Babesia ovata]